MNYHKRCLEIYPSKVSEKEFNQIVKENTYEGDTDWYAVSEFLDGIPTEQDNMDAFEELCAEEHTEEMVLQIDDRKRLRIS